MSIDVYPNKLLFACLLPSQALYRLEIVGTISPPEGLQAMGIHGSIHACCEILFNCLARKGRDGIGPLIRQTHTHLLESRLKRVLAMTGSLLDRFDD